MKPFQQLPSEQVVLHLHTTAARHSTDTVGTEHCPHSGPFSGPWPSALLYCSWICPQKVQKELLLITWIVWGNVCEAHALSKDDCLLG